MNGGTGTSGIFKTRTLILKLNHYLHVFVTMYARLTMKMQYHKKIWKRIRVEGKEASIAFGWNYRLRPNFWSNLVVVQVTKKTDDKTLNWNDNVFFVFSIGNYKMNCELRSCLSLIYFSWVSELIVELWWWDPCVRWNVSGKSTWL